MRLELLCARRYGWWPSAIRTFVNRDINSRKDGGTGSEPFPSLWSLSDRYIEVPAAGTRGVVPEENAHALDSYIQKPSHGRGCAGLWRSAVTSAGSFKMPDFADHVIIVDDCSRDGKRSPHKAMLQTAILDVCSRGLVWLPLSQSPV